MESRTGQDDDIHVDVLCVGAGVASLATALRLLRRAGAAGGKKPTVMVLEKGARVGGHVLSGAVLDPGPLHDLLTGEEMAALPVRARVGHERFAYLTRGGGSVGVPVVPTPMRASGLPIVSLGEVTGFLATLCEEEGGEVYTDMVACAYLEERGRVVGVRLAEKGLDRTGQRKSNYEPGGRVYANVVVLGEGAHGYVSGQLIRNRALARDAHGQAYALGIKELFELPADPSRAGRVLHTFGYPLPWDMYGGGFVYGLDESHVSMGLVVGLDYRRPEVEMHELFRAYKAHPAIRSLLTAGRPVGYGAKVLPEGGAFSVPRLVTDGALLVGDAAGLLDGVRLKGIHLAVQSGLAAGDALYECWSEADWSLPLLRGYSERLEASSVYRSWQHYRNARQWFDHGLPFGMAAVGASWLTGGLLPPGRKSKRPEHEMWPQGSRKPLALPTLQRAVEKELLPDLMSDLFLAGVQHEEDQPCHLLIREPARCVACIRHHDAPCTRFCPARVYEQVEGEERIAIQPANCLHCKTCEIKCVEQIIEWHPPEAGGGPRYKGM